MKFRTRIVSVLVICLCMGLLAGCGKNKRPKTAAELLTMYSAKENTNCSMSYDVDIKMKMSSGGMELDIPMAMKATYNLKDNKAYMNMHIDMEMLGFSESVNTETYYEISDEATTMYMNEDNTDTWYKMVYDKMNASYISDLRELSNTMIADGSFDNSEFVYDEGTKQYTVSIKFADELDKVLDSGLMSNILDLYSNIGVDMDLEEIFSGMSEDAKYEYIFDEDLNLLAINFDDFSLDIPIPDDYAEINLHADYAISVEFSRFGEIKDEDVTVPEDIVAQAILITE